IKNAIRNFFLALKVIPQEKPQAVVSAGAGVAVPFFVAAKLFRVKTMYIECYDRPTLPTMTGKMLYILADSFNVQNEEQQKNFPDSTILHPIF
ncbi:MAG: UDP-N-acetylglucosamine--LPS N-acetylglucosamine transferase, partial [Rothia dentocariosa]